MTDEKRPPIVNPYSDDEVAAALAVGKKIAVKMEAKGSIYDPATGQTQEFEISGIKPVDTQTETEG